MQHTRTPTHAHPHTHTRTLTHAHAHFFLCARHLQGISKDRIVQLKAQAKTKRDTARAKTAKTARAKAGGKK